MSHNPAGPGKQHRLKVVKKLARVTLNGTEAVDITALRLKLLRNGYVPIPSRDKRTLYKGWNALQPNASEVESWLKARSGSTIHAATGLQVTDRLLTVDGDIPDANIALEIRRTIETIAPQLFESKGALERGRDDGSPKTMLFCRRASDALPFTIKSQKWSMNPEDEHAPTYMVEIFASDRNSEGKVARQVGAFGPHTVEDETGKILIRYQWRGASPAEVPLADLPVLDEAAALKIASEVDRILQSKGMKPLIGYRAGKIVPRDVYDLDDSTRFDGEDFTQIDLAELTEIYQHNDTIGLSTRCSGSFTGEGGTRLDRCQVGWSGSAKGGHLTVHDHATEITHRPAVNKPETPKDHEKSFNELAEMFKDIPTATPAEPAKPSFQDRFNAAAGEAVAGSLTERSLALALARLYQDDICYVPNERQWLRFKSPRWVEETEAWIGNMVIGKFCHAFPAPRTPAGEKFRKTMESQRHISSVEKLLRGFLEYKGGFDRDPYLAAGPQLAVNLKSGEARLGLPRDRIRLSWAYDPSPKEDCPRWKKFIGEVTSEDVDIGKLLQQWAGLGLCGDPSHQRLAFLYGTGRNGKNTYADTLVDITGGAPGGYSFPTRFETFMEMRFQPHPTELWALKGKRMVIASEVPDGAVWNVQRIKDLTGNATMTAHAMRRDNETFARTWTLTLLGNNRPQLKNVDPAIKSRIRIIPFLRNFEEEGLMDPDLPKKLLEEAPGILRWAINGLLEVRRNKAIIEPASVLKETEAYFADEDVRARFFAECMEEDAKAETPIGEIFRAWVSYAEANSATVSNQRSLSAWLVKNTKARSGGRTESGRWLSGVRLKCQSDWQLGSGGDIFHDAKPKT